MCATQGKLAPNVKFIWKDVHQNIKCAMLILDLFKVIMCPDKNS